MKRQLASLLVLALCAASPIKAASATFYDVPSSHWAYEDIQQAAGKGILQGTGTDQNGNRLFEPQSSLTTAQFITILVRMFGWESVGGEDAAIDIADSWAREFVNTAAANGVIDAH